NQVQEIFFVTDGQGRELAGADFDGSRIQTVWGEGSFRWAGMVGKGSSFDATRMGNSNTPGVSLFRNRSYDANSGRWLQEDPIGIAGGINLYQFNGNNPVSYTDPFGLCDKQDKVCRSMGYVVLTFFGVSDQTARKIMTPAVIGAPMFGPGTGPGVRAIGQGFGQLAAAKGANTGPVAGTTYTPKVARQMESGDNHAFPKLVDQFAADGSATKIVGGDGVVRTKIQLPGAKNGAD